MFEDLSFPPGGNTVSVNIYPRGSDREVAAYLAPQGLLAALLHATAVASSDEGGLVAIDEFENSLHPEAINALIDSFREYTHSHGVSVVLATHSPVVLDAFRESPEQVFVMDPSEASLPVSLTAIRDADWLKHFSLGDLYKHREFGARGTAR